MKRFLDIVLSIILLLVLSPFLLFIALLIKLDSRGPVIFRQKRVGQNGVKFTVFKFRTMKNNCPHLSTQKLHNHGNYITGIGSFLRRNSLDELPQLVNILKGEMSFVGPRPVISSEMRLLKLREELGVFKVKPGVTGWAQINGRDHVSITEKAELDAYYIHNQSLMLDLKIAVKTVIKILKRDGILEHGSRDLEPVRQVEPVEQEKKEVAATGEESSF